MSGAPHVAFKQGGILDSRCTVKKEEIIYLLKSNRLYMKIALNILKVGNIKGEKVFLWLFFVCC